MSHCAEKGGGALIQRMFFPRYDQCFLLPVLLWFEWRREKRTLKEPTKPASLGRLPLKRKCYWQWCLHRKWRRDCLSNAFGRLSNHFDFCPCVLCVCVCVCPPIGCRTITSAIIYRYSPNFACLSEMWLFRTLLFLGQSGSSLPILEMCKVRYWQFCDCGGHIFQRIVTKTSNEI